MSSFQAFWNGSARLRNKAGVRVHCKGVWCKVTEVKAIGALNQQILHLLVYKVSIGSSRVNNYAPLIHVTLGGYQWYGFQIRITDGAIHTLA